MQLKWSSMISCENTQIVRFRCCPREFGRHRESSWSWPAGMWIQSAHPLMIEASHSEIWRHGLLGTKDWGYVVKLFQVPPLSFWNKQTGILCWRYMTLVGRVPGMILRVTQRCWITQKNADKPEYANAVWNNCLLYRGVCSKKVVMFGWHS